MPYEKPQTCPLCGSRLTAEKYFKIVGVWEERKRLETFLKGEKRQLELERTRLPEENKKIRREEASGKRRGCKGDG